MLSPKKGLCPICNDGKEKYLIGDVCGIHYWGALRKNSRPLERTRGLVRSVPVALCQDDAELDQWYNKRIDGMSGRCWECNALLPTWNRRFAKACIAHILCKEKFLSISTHELNFMELGGECGCHKKWDNHWEGAQRMTVFEMAVQRFIIIYPAIAWSERRYIPEILLNRL